MRNLDAHFSCQDASLVLQCFYGLHVCGQYIACYYTEHIHSRCGLTQGRSPGGAVSHVYRTCVHNFSNSPPNAGRMPLALQVFQNPAS